MKNKFILLSFLSFSSFSFAQIDSFCINCHGDRGQINALGRSKPIGGMKKEDLLREMKLYKQGKLNKYGFGGLMKAKMFEIDEKDFDRIAEKISKQNITREED